MSTIPPTPPMVPEMTPAYPATLEVDYPDRKLNRLTSFFRIFTLIPIAIILGMLTSGNVGWGENSHGWQWIITAGGILFVPLVLMILFRQKYPKW
jgi:MFS family permease